MSDQIKRVAIVLLTKKPDGETVAILQRRGLWNFEKHGPESFPGACQLSAAGKLEVGEAPDRALIRELGEELGIILGDSPGVLLEEGGTRIYGALVPYEFLSGVKLHAGTGGLVFVSAAQAEKIRVLDPKADKADGIKDLNVIALFGDEKAGVLLAFQRL